MTIAPRGDLAEHDLRGVLRESKTAKPDEPDEPEEPDAEDEAFRQAQSNLRKAPGDLEARAQFRQALRLRRQARARCQRAGSETIPWRRYRRLREFGYTPVGARWEIEQDAAEAAAATEATSAAPSATATHAAAETVKAQPPQPPAWGTVDPPAYTPLEFGDSHTAFEWMMLAADLDPNAPWIGIPGDTMRDAQARETRMLALVTELWLNLKQDIEDKEVKPVSRGYYRTIGGFRRQDLTTSVFDAETIAAFFKRVGGHQGEKIAAWLSEREQQPRAPACSPPASSNIALPTVSTNEEPAAASTGPRREVLPGRREEREARLDQWWAHQRFDALPDRDNLLDLLKEDFGNANRKDARALRSKYAPDEKRRGGAPTHRSRRA
jgi:hypothetical protein